MHTEKNLKKWTKGIKNTHTDTWQWRYYVIGEGQYIKYGSCIQWSLNNGHKRYTKWQDIKDLETQKTTGLKSAETVWNYIATSVHL